MHKKAIRKITKEEKIIKLLSYLKKYTDKDNPASIPMIERYFTTNYCKNFFGDKNTRKNTIKNMVRAINSDSKGNLLPKKEWRIIYDDFVRDNINEPWEHPEHHICNIYYNQEFSNQDITNLIDSVKGNTSLDKSTIDLLCKKIETYLKNDNYGKRGMTPAQRTIFERKQRIFNAEIEAAIWCKEQEDYY